MEFSIVLLVVGNNAGTVIIAHRAIRVRLVAQQPLEGSIRPAVLGKVTSAHLRLGRFGVARGVDDLAEEQNSVGTITQARISKQARRVVSNPLAAGVEPPVAL